MRATACLLILAGLAAAQAPTNGEPSGAIPIFLGVNPGAPAGASGSTYSNVGEPSPPSTAVVPFTCGSGPERDVFFTFVAPNTAYYALGTCDPVGFAPGSNWDTEVQALSAAGTASLGCATNGCDLWPPNGVVYVSLTAGSSILLRVAGRFGLAGTFYVTVTEFLAAPNDACGSATPIVEGADTEANTFGAAPTGTADCVFGSGTPDVWFSYVPSATGAVLLTRSGLGATRTAVYAGGCAAPSLVVDSCQNGAAGATGESVFDVVAGANYLVRIGSAGGVGAPFRLRIDPPVPHAISADECTTAATVGVGAFAGSTAGASLSLGATTECSSMFGNGVLPGYGDVWFRFVAPIACRMRVTRHATNPTQTPVVAYTGDAAGTCATLTAPGAFFGFCSPPDFDVVAGAVYYIRVGTPVPPPIGLAVPSTFIVKIACAPYLVNDECSGAAPLSLGDNGPIDNTETRRVNDVGFSTPCGFNGRVGAHDLFFLFQAPCSGTTTISTCGGDAFNFGSGMLFDTQLVVHDAWSCGFGPIGPAVACSEVGPTPGMCGATFVGGSFVGEAEVTFAANAGTTYLVRACGPAALATGQFGLSVRMSTAAVAAVGSGCGSPEPVLTASGPPTLGSSPVLSVASQPSAPGLLVASAPASPTDYWSAGGCAIYLDPSTLLPLAPFVTDAAGVWAAATVVPSDPALTCFTLDLQAVVSGAAGLQTTNALRVVLGS